MSFSAAHWLREQPEAAVPNGFYFCEATGKARTALAEEADADWTAFLEARASDLAAGGRLLVQMVGSAAGADGAEPDVTARKLLRAMTEVATGMANNGVLDRGAVRRYVLPVYARTVDEARAPLTRADSPVHDAFTVIECRTDPVANPYFTKWSSDHDNAAYATRVRRVRAGLHRVQPARTPLRSERDEADVDSAVDEFFTRLTRALRGRSRTRPVRRLDTDRRTRTQLRGLTPWDGSTTRWR